MKMPDISFLNEPDGQCERLLQEQWNRIPANTKLRLADGRDFIVQSRGVWNHGPGPDFSDAVLDFPEGERRGDIEIHFRASDWIAHNHSNDPAYANVILHVVEINDASPGNTPFLPEVPVCLLPDLEYDSNGAAPVGECSLFFRKLDDSMIVKYVESAGVRRVIEKSHIVLSDIISQGTGYAFWSAVFRLLGVPENRDSFSELFQRVNHYPAEIRRKSFTEILWGESGLLPDPATLPAPSAEFVSAVWKTWWKIRKDGAVPPFFVRRSRPVNSPERRIAFIAALYRAFSEDPVALFREKFSKEESCRPAELRRLFDVSDPFWDYHLLFTSETLSRKSALAGIEKQTSLLIDVLYPLMLAVSELEENESMRDMVLHCFRITPQTSGNRTTRLMTDACFNSRSDLFKTAAAQQGLICLYKEFCGKYAFDCRVCDVYRSFR